MPRLIDANELTVQIMSMITDKAIVYGNDSIKGSKEIFALAMIAQAPTIDAKPHWIPCSERLPEDSGDYLVRPSDSVLEDYSDFSEIMIMPYDADCEAFGWWVERYNPISLGYLDSDFNEFEVLAWMPLPKPYEVEK